MGCSSVNINHLNSKGRTALGVAASASHLDVVKLLLSHTDIDVNAGDDTPLYLATWGRHRYEIARVLLNNSNIDVNKRSEGWHPIYTPAHNGDSAMVKLLIKHPKTDVNSKTHSMTALMIATKRRMTEVVKILLRCPRTDITIKDSPDRWGQTALDYAKEKGYADIISAFASQQNLMEEEGPTCTATNTSTIPKYDNSYFDESFKIFIILHFRWMLRACESAICKCQ